MLKINTITLIMATSCTISFFHFSLAQLETEGWKGKHNGVKTWQLMNTPNGMKPIMCWDGIGTTPQGILYVAGMDHKTNSALYRIEPATDKLRYLGDAKAASEASNNYKNEPLEKFHTKPTWFNGKVYVSNLNYSGQDEGYLNVRGAKWFAYDESQDKFFDLSASQPHGVAIEHGGFVTIMLDQNEGIIYGMMHPTGDLYCYTIATNKTIKIGRPSGYDREFLYPCRFMWQDSRHRIYLTAGNEEWGVDNIKVYGHVYYYDTKESRFGELTDWKLNASTAIQVGQISRDGKQVFAADDKSRLYRFTDSVPTWEYIERMVEDDGKLWVFQLSADSKKIYFFESFRTKNSRRQVDQYFYEFDLELKISKKICELSELDPKITKLVNMHTGFDTWDNNGCFYVTSFMWDGLSGVELINTYVHRIDPVRVKVALGLLPKLVEASVQAGLGKFIVKLNGPATEDFELLYDAIGYKPTGIEKKQGITVMPKGNDSVDVAVGNIGFTGHLDSVAIEIIPDGNEYVAATPRRAVVTGQNINSINNKIDLKNNASFKAFKLPNRDIIVEIEGVRSSFFHNYQVVLYSLAGKRVIIQPLWFLENGQLKAILPSSIGLSSGITILKIFNNSPFMPQLLEYKLLGL